MKTDWKAVHRDYLEAWPGGTLRALAEQHDVGYDALRRRAKREGWEGSARLSQARKRVQECEAELKMAREVAAEAGRYVARLCRTSRVSLQDLAQETNEAGYAVVRVWSAAHHLATSRLDLEDAEAGRPRDLVHGSPLGQPDPRWDRPTRWPEFNVMAYRTQGPAALPKKLTPAKLALGTKAA